MIISKNKFFLNVVVLALIIVLPQYSMVVTIKNPPKNLAQRYSDLGYDVVGLFDQGLVLVVSEDEYIKLSESFFIEITDTDEALSKRVAKMRSSSKNRQITIYPTYEEYVSELQQLQTDYPNLCQVASVGKSQGKIYYESGDTSYQKYNQSIWLIKLSDNVLESEDEPGYMLFGEHHSREPSSLHVTLSILRWLLENYTTNDKAKKIVDECQIWFMPLVNPNGYTVVLTEENRMMRKNIRDNNLDKQVNAYYWNIGATVDGVDLNRNYSPNWGTSGTSHSSTSSVYCGPNVESEPEVKIVCKVLDSLPNILAEISYHSYAQKILYAPAYNGEVQLSNAKTLIDLGKKIAGATKKADGSGEYYSHGTPKNTLGYTPSGTLMDYTFIKKGIFGYCSEIGWKFVMDTNLDVLAMNNLNGAKQMFDRHNYATITGTVKTSNDEIVFATISIDGVDDKGDNRYISDSLYGRYYRFLMPGSYTVTVTPNNNEFKAKTFNDVIVYKDKPTVLDVTYSTTSSVKKNNNQNSIDDIKNFCNSIHFLINNANGKCIFTLFDVSGQQLFNTSSVSSVNELRVNCSSVPAGVYFYQLTDMDGIRFNRVILK